jgi:hypothetical protein
MTSWSRHALDLIAVLLLFVALHVMNPTITSLREVGGIAILLFALLLFRRRGGKDWA